MVRFCERVVCRFRQCSVSCLAYLLMRIASLTRIAKDGELFGGIEIQLFQFGRG